MTTTMRVFSLCAHYKMQLGRETVLFFYVSLRWGNLLCSIFFFVLFLSFIPQPRWMCRLPNEFNQSKGNRWTVVSFLYIVTRINGFLDSHFSTLGFRFNAGGGVCHGLRTKPIQNHCSIPCFRWSAIIRVHKVSRKCDMHIV